MMVLRAVLRKLIIISSLPLGLEGRSAGVLGGITKMTIFLVGFSQALHGLGRVVPGSPEPATSVLDAGHLNRGTFPLNGLPVLADINGFERRKDPQGVCKTLVRKRKKKNQGCGLGPESSVTEILIQLFCSSAQFPFSAPCKGCVFS